MMPNPTLLESYQKCLVSETEDPIPLSLKDVLSAINERITYIYDRDHQIGHSYSLISLNWRMVPTIWMTCPRYSRTKSFLFFKNIFMAITRKLDLS